MKQIILVRHAKSDWNDITLTDFQRVLNKRGSKDAPRMGALLHEKDLPIDIIHSSSAERTKQTAQLLAKEIAYPKTAIYYHDNLYLATERQLLDFINGLDKTLHTILLVAHNPGISDFARYLVNSNLAEFPTCGMACINFQLNSWEEISFGTGTLQWFEYPKNLQ